MRQLLCVIITILCFSLKVGAQSLGDMSSDRKTHTKTAMALPKGIIQIETGFHYEGDRESGVKVSFFNLNTTLLRLGVTDGFELRLEGAYSKLSVNGNGVAGMSPVKIGFKSQVATSNGSSPDIAIIGGLVPANSGSRHFSDARWGVEALSAFGWSLPKKLDLGANIGFVTDTEFQSFQVPVSGALGFPIDYKLGGFVELIGVFQKSDDTQISGATGLTYKQSTDLQFDIYIGKGINKPANDWFYGFGLSWRMGPLFR